MMEAQYLLARSPFPNPPFFFSAYFVSAANQMNVDDDWGAKWTLHYATRA
jgi:hypothetical protein